MITSYYIRNTPERSGIMHGKVGGANNARTPDADPITWPDRFDSCPVHQRGNLHITAAGCWKSRNESSA